MPESTGENAAAQALDLRLWVPAEGDLRQIAGVLAAKVAEHLGAAPPDAQSLAARVAGLASQMANGGGPEPQDIAMKFRQVEGELVIEARCAGEAAEVRQPIPVQHR